MNSAQIEIKYHPWNLYKRAHALAKQFKEDHEEQSSQKTYQEYLKLAFSNIWEEINGSCKELVMLAYIETRNTLFFRRAGKIVMSWGEKQGMQAGISHIKPNILKMDKPTQFSII